MITRPDILFFKESLPQSAFYWEYRFVDRKTEDYISDRLCETLQIPPSAFSHPDLREDLDIDLLVGNAFSSRFPAYATKIFCSAPSEIETILRRQEFVKSLTQEESKRKSLEEITETTYNVVNAMIERDKVKKSYYGNPNQSFVPDSSYIDLNTMRAQTLLKNIAIMENYVKVIEALHGLGADTKVSERLSSFASSVFETENFQELAKCVHAFLNDQYIVLGIKLDSLNGIRESRYVGVWEGKEELPIEEILRSAGWKPVGLSMVKLFDGPAVLVYETINKIIEKNFGQIMETTLLIGELDFYLSAANFSKTILESKIPICFPEMLKMERRSSNIESMYHPVLLYQEDTKIKNGEDIISSDFQYDSGKHIFIITGPNNGGKSVYVKSVGLTQLLAQNGFPVPARKAELSVVDGIYSHFVKGGDIKKGQGRHSDDCRRLRKIFERITPHSFVVLDDLYGGGTSSLEAKEEALIQFEYFNRIGAATLLTTHVHEISLEAESIPYATNLHVDVTEKDGEIIYTRRLIPGRATKSYGRLVAEQEGVGEKGLRELVEKRVKEGTLPPSVLK